MYAPSYADVTRLSRAELADAMERVRGRLTSYDTIADGDAAYRDWLALVAEWVRRAGPLRAEEVILLDDGTLDTVVQVRGVEFRYSDTSEYRDPETGALDLAAFTEEHLGDLEDALAEMDAAAAEQEALRGTES